MIRKIHLNRLYENDRRLYEVIETTKKNISFHFKDSIDTVHVMDDLRQLINKTQVYMNISGIICNRKLLLEIKKTD